MRKDWYWFDRLVAIPLAILFAAAVGIVWLALLVVAYIAALAGGFALLLAAITGSTHMLGQAALCIGFFMLVKFGPMLFSGFNTDRPAIPVRIVPPTRLP